MRLTFVTTERCKHLLYRSNLQRTLQYFQFSINICSRKIISPTIAWRSHPSVLDSYCRTRLVPGQYPVHYHSLVLQWSSCVCFVSYNHDHYLFVEGLPSGGWVNLSCVLLGEQKVLGNWGSWGYPLTEDWQVWRWNFSTSPAFSHDNSEVCLTLAQEIPEHLKLSSHENF